jgi:AcrR family transcriptional regulator
MRVLEAATRIILHDGFDVSMDMVADAAGVSKQTIYAYFDGKDALFREVVDRLVRPASDSITCDGHGIGVTLRAVAEAFRSTRKGDCMSLGRLLVCAPPRALPSVRQRIQNLAEGMHKRLSRCMAETMACGFMRRDDPDVAAGLFLAMLSGIEGDDVLFGRAVTLFLQAYDIRQPWPPSALSS